MSCVPMGCAQHRLIGDDVGRFGDWGSIVAASAFSPNDQLAVATVHCAEAVCDGYGAAVLVENGRAVLVPENVLMECVSLSHTRNVLHYRVACQVAHQSTQSVGISGAGS